jgi:uncharacterized protein YbdZ (MbtH family)
MSAELQILTTMIEMLLFNILQSKDLRKSIWPHDEAVPLLNQRAQCSKSTHTMFFRK